MILKLIRGDYFQGLVRYVTRTGEYAGKDEARLLRMEGLFNLKTATAQLLQQASLAPRRTRRAIHILGRAERGLTDDQYHETARRSLAALDLQGRPFLSVVHDDDGHFHLVTVEQDEMGRAPRRRLYSRSLKRDVTRAEAQSRGKGDVASRSWDSHACWRLSRVARELEVEFGLRKLRTGVSSQGPEETAERLKVPDWQLKREAELGLLPLAIEFEAEIKAALSLSTWDERAEALSVYGLAIRPYQGANAKRQGIQIYAAASPNHACNGSDLGKNYGLGALNKRSDVALVDWLAKRDVAPIKEARDSAAAPCPPDRAERNRLRESYAAYEEDHRRRRGERRDLNREIRRRRRRIAGTIWRNRKDLLADGQEKTKVRQSCRLARRAIENMIEAFRLEESAKLDAFPPRKLTWAEWLTEKAVNDPAARRVYEDMRRRLNKEDRQAAIAVAAEVQVERNAKTQDMAEEAALRRERAAKAEKKLTSLTPTAKVAVDVVSAAATVSHAPPPQKSEPVAATMPPQRPSAPPAPPPPPPPRDMPAPAQSFAAGDGTDRAPIAKPIDSGRKEKLDAMLAAAARDRWQVFGDRYGYRFNKSFVEGWPEGLSLINDPSHVDHLKQAMAGLFQQQEKEVEQIIEALDKSQCIALTDKGYVLDDSVAPEVRPLLKPRRWWREITEAAKQRIEALAEAAARRAEAVAPAKGESGPRVPTATSTPYQVAIRGAAQDDSAERIGLPPTHASPPSSQGAQVTPAAGTPQKLKASDPVLGAASSTGDEVAVSAVTSEPAESSNLPASAARDEASVASSTEEDAQKDRSQGEVPAKMEAVPPRAVYDGIFAGIEEFDFPIIRDPRSGEYRLDAPPAQWLPILCAPAYAAETRRRVNDMAVARIETSKVVALVTGTSDKPSQIRFEGEDAVFPGLGPEDRALYEKYRTSERVVEALDVARELYADSEAARQIELAKFERDRQKGRG